MSSERNALTYCWGNLSAGVQRELSNGILRGEGGDFRRLYYTGGTWRGKWKMGLQNCQIMGKMDVGTNSSTRRLLTNPDWRGTKYFGGGELEAGSQMSYHR